MSAPNDMRTATGVSLLVLLSLPILFWNLGGYSVVNGDEAFYQTAAREMARGGNWFRLEVGGVAQPYDTFMNAPTHYWARAALITVFGDNLWTMRVLAALFGLGSVLVTFALVRTAASARAAFLAALAQLTTLQFVYLHSARTGEIDSILAFVFGLTAWLFLRALDSRRSFLPHHVCLLLLLTLKLPVIVMPVLAELAFFALTPSARGRFREWALAGIGLLPVFLVWHVGQALAYREVFVGVVTTMLAEAGGAHPVVEARHVGVLGNLGYYGRTILFGAFPWALVYPFAIVAGGDARTPAARSLRRLLVLHPLALFVFYSLVDKHYRWYVVPAYPFLSALSGLWLERLWSERPRLGAGLALGALLVLAMAAWVELEVIGFNPFDRDAVERAFAAVAGRRAGSIGPLVGVPLTLAGVAGALALAARAGHADFSRTAGGVCVVALCTIALARVLYPLPYTRYTSGLEQLHHELALAKSTGKTIPEPVLVPSRFMRKVWYYFIDDFHVLRCEGPRHRYFVLVDRDLEGPPEARVRCAMFSVPGSP